MKPRVSSLSLTFTRSYATRLPQRPPYRAPDPLKSNPHAHYQALPGDLTFIHRPPPSAPTPESLTTMPSSPLLRPVSADAPAALPPILFPRKKPELPPVSEEVIDEMRRLRREDPEKWTAGTLAKKFNCSQGFVRLVAKLPRQVQRAALQKRDEDHEAFRSKWGEKRLMQKEIRDRRREFW